MRGFIAHTQRMRIQNDGFTLMEFVIAIGISAIIVLGVAGALTQETKMGLQLSEKIGKHADRRISSKYFIDFASAAGLSSQFIHMPIPHSGCGTGLPCVRKLDSTTMKFSSAAGFTLPTPPSEIAGSSYVEFYRDDYGYLYTTPSSGSDVTYLAKTADYGVTDSLMNGYYATWVLQDPSSAPLIAFGHASTPDYLTFKNVSLDVLNHSTAYCGTPTYGAIMSAANTAGYAFYMPSSTNPVDTSQFKLVLVYDGADPTQYYFQVVESIVQCGATGSPNYELCNSTWEIYKNAAGVTNPTYSEAFTAAPYPYLIKMKPVPAEANIQPTITYPDAYPSQDAIKAFPTLVPSSMRGDASTGTFIVSSDYKPTTPTSYDLVHRVHTADYCKTNSFKTMVVVPVNAVKLYVGMADGTAGTTCDSSHPCALFSSKFTTTGTSYEWQPFRIADNIDGSIVVARQIGTQSISLFMYNGFGVSDWSE